MAYYGRHVSAVYSGGVLKAAKKLSSPGQFSAAVFTYLIRKNVKPSGRELEDLFMNIPKAGIKIRDLEFRLVDMAEEFPGKEEIDDYLLRK